MCATLHIKIIEAEVCWKGWKLFTSKLISMISTMNNSNIKKTNLCSLGSLAARGPGLVGEAGSQGGESWGSQRVRQSGSQAALPSHQILLSLLERHDPPWCLPHN